MKLTDTLKLIKYEYNYGKGEWISSIVMNVIVIACILLSMTVTLEINSVCNDYISMGYPNGYKFSLVGFNEQDVEWLENRGFTKIVVSDVENGCAVNSDISRIWIYKFEALFSGKDIWNEDIDLVLEVMLFGNIIFMAISVMLFAIMSNSNSNSFNMKLNERKYYIDMLIYLGMTKSNCIRIYFIFFLMRIVLATMLATGINVIFMTVINNHIQNVLGVDTEFSLIKPMLVVIVFIFSTVIMNLSFGKVWRKKNDE